MLLIRLNGEMVSKFLSNSSYNDKNYVAIELSCNVCPLHHVSNKTIKHLSPVQILSTVHYLVLIQLVETTIIINNATITSKVMSFG